MILTCIAIGLAPAFKMRFWNVGAEGQMLVGGIATAFWMINFAGKMNTVMLFLCMAISAVVAGGIWGLIPGFFKAKWNTNETLFTLMMNYIAIQLTSFCRLQVGEPSRIELHRHHQLQGRCQVRRLDRQHVLRRL